MFANEPARMDGGRQIVRHHLGAAQARWGRLTIEDYARIVTTADLITLVGERYSIPAEDAKQDVDGWLQDIGL